MKRKEIKWRREGRRVMTGRQDGVIFRIWTPYDAPEKGYSVSSNDTKGRGRAVAEAKEFRGHLERAGISYTTLLHLVALQEGMGGLAHNILLGYEHGEGWPDGT